MKAIEEYPIPKSKKQLRAFLGVVEYYRRFIRNFHRWSSVLTPSTSKTGPRVVEWTNLKTEAFRELCNVLSCNVKLCVPCTPDVFVLECDACATGVGKVQCREGRSISLWHFSLDS